MTDDLTVCPNCGEEVQAAAVEQEVVAEEVGQTVAEEATQAEAPTQEPAAEQVELPAEPPKKKKTGLVLGIVGGVVAVAAILVAVFFGQIKGFAIKTFGDSGDYYRYVEATAFEGFNDGVAEVYGTYVEPEKEEAAAETKITFDVSKAAQDKICEALGGEIDLDWLNEIAITSDSNLKDDAMSSTTKLKISDTDILVLDLIQDLGKKAVYVGLPSLDDRYLAITGEDMESADEESRILMEIINDEEFKKILPTEKEVNELLDKYTLLILDNIEDVEMSTEAVNVEGVEQKLTVLKAEVDTDAVAVICKAVLKEARGDEVIKKYINDVAKYLEDEDLIPDADEVYDEYIDLIDDAMDDIEDGYENEQLLDLYTYVDNAHNVVGRKVTFDVGGEASYVAVRNGKEVGVELVIDLGEDEEIVARGKGVRDGNLMDMEISAFMRDERVMVTNVSDVKLAELKEGYFNGKIHIEADRGLFELSDLTDAEIDEIEEFEMSLDINCSADKDKSATSVTFNYEGEAFAGLKVTAKPTEPKKVALPDEDKTVAVEDAEEWVTSFDLTKIVDALRKAKLPTEIVDALEMALDPNYDFDYGDEIYNEDLSAPGGEGEYGDEELWGDEEYWDDEDRSDLGI